MVPRPSGAGNSTEFPRSKGYVPWTLDRDMELVESGLKALVADFPQLKGIGVSAAWGGVIDTAPDLMPVISRAEGLDGLVISSGFSGHGFGIGPGAGRLTSELVLNETPFTEVTPYRLDRFSDGSAIRRPEMM